MKSKTQLIQFTDRPGIYPSNLLTFVFEQRLSFHMIYFTKGDPENVVKCRGFGGAVRSAVGSWRSLAGGSGSKGPGKVYFFTSGGQINSLK